jgi:Tfp pilus assembly protein PilN
MNGESLRIGYVLRESEGERAAVVVAVRDAVYQGYIKAVKGAGLKPQALSLSSFGTANAYLDAFPEGAPGIVVDIGARMTEITLSAWGRFAASRQASIGVENLIETMGEKTGMSRAASSQAMRGASIGPQAPPGVMDWAAAEAAEIDRTLRAFATEGLPAPERVLLTGGGGRIEGLAEYLSRQVGVPVELFPDDAGVGAWPEGTQSPGSLFVPALGYLLGGFAGVGTRFDLGAEFFARADVKPRATRKYIVAALVAVLLVAAWAIPDYTLDIEESDLKAAEKDLDKREAEVDERLGTLQEKLSDLRSWTQPRAQWIDVLREITVAVPESKEVFLVQVNFSLGGDALKIMGRAVSAEAVNGFADRLTRSAFFYRVERRTLQQHRDRKEAHRWDFELNTYLREPEEEVSR